MVLKRTIKESGTTNSKHDEKNVIKTWSNGKLIRGKKKIDSFNYSLHYSGYCVWEGIRAYKQFDGNCKIFKLKEHIDRLFNSAKIIGFEIPFSKNQIMEGCKAVINASGESELYIRPIVYIVNDAEGIKTEEEKINVDIYCFPAKKIKNNIKVKIGPCRGYPQYEMQAKTPSNYHFLTKAKNEANQSGVDDLLLTDNHGYITESIAANLFIVKGNLILTPPNDGSILPGITRATVVDFLQDQKLMFSKYKKVPVVAEKKITKADIYTADCAFLVGTYSEVIKIIEVDGRKIEGDDFYYKLLKEEYQNIVRGKYETR